MQQLGESNFEVIVDVLSSFKGDDRVLAGDDRGNREGVYFGRIYNINVGCWW